MKKLLAALCVVVACFSTAAVAAVSYPTNVNTLIVRTDTTAIGQEIDVPANPTVVATIAVFAPGARIAVHKHLYPHYAYVLDGTLTITNTQTGKTFDVTAGQFLAEMQDTWHYGQNRRNVPVRLLIVDQLPKGVAANVVPKDPKAGPPSYATNVNTPVARTDKTIIGQTIEVPKNPTVVVSSSTFAPGAKTPVHKHLYPHYVYIQDGTLTIVNTEIGKSFEMKPGTFFLEMIDKWHYGINNGKVPVHTLVIDQIPAGVEANHVLKDPSEAASWHVH